MLFNKIREDMVSAMKNADKVSKDILSLLLNQLKNKIIDLRVDKLSEDESFAIIRKLIKQLDEEISIYKNAGRVEMYLKLETQRKVLERYLPKQLTEEEIKDIIGKLDDKSVPSVMKHFKTNYSGLCDMSLVNRILRNL